MKRPLRQAPPQGRLGALPPGRGSIADTEPSPLVRIVGAALAGLLYFIVTQFVAVGYLLLAAWAGWDVPGYHEPPEYRWWSWIVFSLWCAGFALVAWWAAFKLPFRRSPNNRP